MEKGRERRAPADTRHGTQRGQIRILFTLPRLTAGSPCQPLNGRLAKNRLVLTMPRILLLLFDHSLFTHR